MSTRVEKTVLVNVPVSQAYNQWTQFEDFPHFMNGIKKVTQLGDDRLEWVAELAGVRRKWEARILEQVPDRKVAWAATEGATNAGEVSFQALSTDQTSIHLTLEYEPEGLVEKVGDKLNVVENQAEGDLERFKAFIESEGYASGAWRGTIDDGLTAGTPGVEDAAASRGDSGKAGVSGKVAAAAGVAAVAAAAVGVAAAAKAKDSGDSGAEAASLAVPADTVTTEDADVTFTPVTDESAIADDAAGAAVLDPDVDPTLDSGSTGRGTGTAL